MAQKFLTRSISATSITEDEDDSLLNVYLAESGHVCLDILGENSEQHRYMSTQVLLLSFHNSHFRVCYALLHLADRFGKKHDKSCTLDLKFTHQEMGNLTGLSRVSVSNILLDLSKNNVIRKEDGYWNIVDVEKLYALGIINSKNY